MNPQNLFRRMERRIRSKKHIDQEARHQEEIRRAIVQPAQKLHVTQQDRWGVWFAGYEFGESYEGNHGCIGSIGSGKSLILDLFIRDVGKVCFFGSRNFACIVDIKGTVPKMLMGEGIPFAYVNISDKRASAIDIAAACNRDPIKIAAVISPFIEKDEKNPFWSHCNEGILNAVARGLKQQLSFSNIYRVTSEGVALIAEALSQHPSNALIESLLWKPADDRLRGNILAGLAATLEPFAIAAAHDYYARHKVNLRQMLDEGGVLVLGLDMASINVTLPFYQIVLNILIDLIIGRSDHDIKGSSFVIIDELPTLKRLENFPKLMAVGRSKKCHAAYSVQQTKQLYSYYGEGEVAAIFGNTDHICYLRSNDPDTEALLSRKFGEELIPQVSYSSTYTRSVEYVRQPRLMPGALGRLKAPSREDGIYFYMDSRYFSAPIPHPFRLPGEWVEINKPKVDATYPAFVPKPAWMNVIPPLSKEESEALLHGIPLNVPLPMPKNSFEKIIFQEVKQYLEVLIDEVIVSIGDY